MANVAGLSSSCDDAIVELYVYPVWRHELFHVSEGLEKQCQFVEDRVVLVIFHLSFYPFSTLGVDWLPNVL